MATSSMMRRALLLAGLASCFGEPTYEGRRCSNQEPCPEPLVCDTGGICRSSGSDASVIEEECTSGRVESCYEGPAGTLDVGPCRAGSRSCVDGRWSACQGAILPALQESCDGLDDDCDGVEDDGCPCAPDESRPCYPGPAGTSTVGLCHPGTQRCNAGAWGGCDGAVEPAAEICDGLDQDCNGVEDDGTNRCGGACPLANEPGAPCDAAEDLDLCPDDAFACDGLNATVCVEGGVDADGDHYSVGPLSCQGDCDDSDQARNLSDPDSCTIVLDGVLSGLYDHPGMIVRIPIRVDVTPYDGNDLLAACDPVDSGCLEIRAAEIHVDGLLSARGSGHGGGGGGGGGAARCASTGCTPAAMTGTMGPGGAGARDGLVGGGAPISSTHGGVGGRGGGESGGDGGARGYLFGCGGDSLPGANGAPGGYGAGSPGLNNDQTTDRTVLLGSGGGGGGGGASSECNGMAGFAGGGGAGNPGGGLVRLLASERIVVDGTIDARGLVDSAGDGMAGVNPSNCTNVDLADVIPGSGGNANLPGTSSPSGHGGLVCSQASPSDGGRGGGGGGGGVLLVAPAVAINGSLDLRGGGDVVDNGGTLKIFSSTITGSAGTFFGRLCVGEIDDACQ